MDADGVIRNLSAEGGSALGGKVETGNSGTSEVLRAFIAVETNDDVRRSLGEVQERLMQAGVDVGWVRPENMHLTLVFLGDIFETVVEPLGRDLDAVAGGVLPFAYTVAGIGSFGPPRKPRVIWAGIEGPPAEMQALWEGAAGAARRLEMPLESRPFKPHLTLGRVRSGRHVDALTSALSSVMNTRHGSVAVRRLLLMRSELDPRGGRYSVLHESALKGA